MNPLFDGKKLCCYKSKEEDNIPGVNSVNNHNNSSQKLRLKEKNCPYLWMKTYMTDRIARLQFNINAQLIIFARKMHVKCTENQDETNCITNYFTIQMPLKCTENQGRMDCMASGFTIGRI